VSEDLASFAVPRSLVWATDFDVLPPDHLVQRREGYLRISSPGNPRHYWGNLLLFDDPPVHGDASRWERLFAAEFPGGQVRHQTFAWDRLDGVIGAAHEEFVVRGYRFEQTVGLVAAPDRIRPHERENREIVVRALDPAPGAEEGLWDQVTELQVAGRDQWLDEQPYRDFNRTRQRDLRELFATGRGAWYVALEPDGGEVLGSCGVVVTAGRGRFQAVDTAAAHRRRGICSRLVVEAAHRATEDHGARRLVIGADPDYHALGLYESLGFEQAERVAGVFREPPG
jgi:ribosomal protein S18 acetylase RimI-like enzyme